MLNAGSASGVISNLLYVTTAEDGFNGYYNYLDVYNPANNSWTALASSPDAHTAPAGFGVSTIYFMWRAALMTLVLFRKIGRV